MLNTASILFLLALQPASLDDSKLRLEPAPTVGASQSLKFNIVAHMEDHVNTLDGKAVKTISKVSPGKTEFSIDWQNLEITSDTAPVDIPFNAYQASVGPGGELLSLSGGLPAQVADPAKVFFLFYFPITDKELVKGTPTAIVLPGSEKEHIPEMDGSETFIGVETLQNVGAYKVAVKLMGAKSEYTIEATYWVDKAGNVLKEDGTFKNMGVTGGTVDGTMKLGA